MTLALHGGDLINVLALCHHWCHWINMGVISLNFLALLSTLVTLALHGGDLINGLALLSTLVTLA